MPEIAGFDIDFSNRTTQIGAIGVGLLAVGLIVKGGRDKAKVPENAVVTLQPPDGLTWSDVIAPPNERGQLGVVGFDGVMGPEGRRGEQGLQGVEGIQGVKGDAGIQGIKGDTGATGARGADGTMIEAPRATPPVQLPSPIGIPEGQTTVPTRGLQYPAYAQVGTPRTEHVPTPIAIQVAQTVPQQAAPVPNIPRISTPAVTPTYQAPYTSPTRGMTTVAGRRYMGGEAEAEPPVAIRDGPPNTSPGKRVGGILPMSKPVVTNRQEQIRAGESLRMFASRTLGDERYVDRIMQLNPGLRQPVGGQTLRVG